jgi:hypothetical protein
MTAARSQLQCLPTREPRIPDPVGLPGVAMPFPRPCGNHHACCHEHHQYVARERGIVPHEKCCTILYRRAPSAAARLPHLGAHGGCCTVGNCEALNDVGRQLVVREQLAPVVARVGSMVTHAPAPPAALPSKAVLRWPAWKGWPRIDMRRRGHRFRSLQDAAHDEIRRPELL